MAKTSEEILGLENYKPEELDAVAFNKRYAGLYYVDDGKRLSRKSMHKIWRNFVLNERIDFFHAHENFTLDDVIRIGVDKLVYTLGWTKPSHVSRWRQHKARVGICGHCKDQFIPLIMPANHGLCHNCRPLYDVHAMQAFVKNQLANSERYKNARYDILMDFYILFYKDDKFRQLFLKENNPMEILGLGKEQENGSEERTEEEKLETNDAGEDQGARETT